MRSKTTTLGLRTITCMLAVGGMTALAEAGNRYSTQYHDHVYADSFGNLVVQSRGGYKRIVVGGGHLAKELTAYEKGGRSDADNLVYSDDGRSYSGGDCYRPPYVVKGRSYMYGFDEGEIPFQGGPCR